MNQNYRFKIGDYFKYDDIEGIKIIGKISYIRNKLIKEDDDYVRISSVDMPVFYYKTYTSNYKDFFGRDKYRFYKNSLMYRNSKILTKDEYILEVL